MVSILVADRVTSIDYAALVSMIFLTTLLCLSFERVDYDDRVIIPCSSSAKTGRFVFNGFDGFVIILPFGF